MNQGAREGSVSEDVSPANHCFGLDPLCSCFLFEWCSTNYRRLRRQVKRQKRERRDVRILANLYKAAAAKDSKAPMDCCGASSGTTEEIIYLQTKNESQDRSVVIAQSKTTDFLE